MICSYRSSQSYLSAKTGHPYCHWWEEAVQLPSHRLLEASPIISSNSLLSGKTVAPLVLNYRGFPFTWLISFIQLLSSYAAWQSIRRSGRWRCARLWRTLWSVSDSEGLSDSESDDSDDCDLQQRFSNAHFSVGLVSLILLLLLHVW